MLITSIDPGIINLAIVTFDTELNKVIYCYLIDITLFPCKYGKCELKHKKCHSNFLEHVFIYYDFLFKCDILLIEQQPIKGIVSIEQLIYDRFKNDIKCILINPRQMHKHFNIGHYNYELRKKSTIKLAYEYLKDQKNYIISEKKDDLSDALCYILFYRYSNLFEVSENISENVSENISENISEISFHDKISKFKYNNQNN